MKKVIAALLAALMIFSLTACQKTPAPGNNDKNNPGNNDNTNPPSDSLDTSNPIYIGVLDAFTGDRASNGEYSKEGADLAMAHINAAGGVMGRAIEIVYEDDQGNETAATNAFQKIDRKSVV